MRNVRIINLLLIILLVNSNSTLSYADMFDNIMQLKEYAHQLEEFPLIDNNAWIDPDFTSVYKQLVPSFFSRLRQSFFHNQKYFQIESFRQRIEQVLYEREMNGYVGEFLQKITPKTGDVFIIFGDLYGAFHSLVRLFIHFYEKGIINESFKIIDTRYYFIFNGSLIGRSPYNFETLTFILQLMRVNQDRLIYLKGKEEEKQSWLYGDFSRELFIRGANGTKETIPFTKMLTRFFNTLPLTLFLRGSSTVADQSVIRIGQYNLEKNGFAQSLYEDFLSDLGTGDLETLKLNSNIGTPVRKPLRIEASIEAEDRTTHYKKTSGLILLDAAKGITTWSVFSSPTAASRRLYDFYYDAFARIDILTYDIASWEISLINRDTHNDRILFQTTATYQLVSGAPMSTTDLKKKFAHKTIEERLNILEDLLITISHTVNNRPATEGAEPSTKHLEERLTQEESREDMHKKNDLSSLQKIVFGCTVDLSKGMSVQGELFKKGLLLRFKEEESLGGIVTNIEIVDDHYDPQTTRKIVETFMKKGIYFLLLSSGSPTLEAYSDLLAQEKIFLFFPSTGAPTFRQEKFKNLLHWRASYDFEGEALLSYAVQLGFVNRKIAIFYQNDIFGNALLQGAEKIIEAKKLTNILKVGYVRNNVDLANQAKKILAYDPDIIIFLATTIAAKELIRQLTPAYCSNKKLMGSSEFGEEAFKLFLKDHGVSFINLNVVPNPTTSKLPIVEQFRKFAGKNDVPIDPFVLEAYISADLMFDIIKKTVGKITVPKIQEVIKQIQNYHYKGLVLNFNPTTRELMNKVWIDTGSDEWLLFEKDKKAEEHEASIVATQPIEGGNRRIPSAIGTILDLSKGLSTQGKMVEKGLLLRFDEERNVHKDETPTLYVQDDEYTPSKTEQRATEAIRDGVDIFIGSTGSATLSSCLDLIKQKKMLVLFPDTGAPVFRTKDTPYIIHWRASYDYEGEVLATYAIETLHAERIALFYQNDDFGKGILEGVKRAIADRKTITIYELPYERNSTSFTEQAKVCRDNHLDTIIFLSTHIAAKALINEIGANDLLHIHLLGNSDCGEGLFLKFIHEKGLKFVIANCVPNPQTSQLPIVQQFRNAAKKVDLPLDPFLMEAYISADILFSTIKKISGNITKESLYEKLKEIHHINYKGLSFNFDPDRHELMHQVWIDSGDGKEWQLVQRKN